MAFAPVARWRNFTLYNIKEVLKVYGEVPEGCTRFKAEILIGSKIHAYERTAYQIFCQAGLQNRKSTEFKIQKYVLGMDNVDLQKYMEFWLNNYYTPNPYVSSTNRPILLYSEIAKKILSATGYKVNLKECFLEWGMNLSYMDIIINIFENYGNPIKRNGQSLYIDEVNKSKLIDKINILDDFAKIPNNHKDKDIFFNRFSEEKFKQFYSLTIPKEATGDNSVVIPISYNIEQSKVEEIIREAEEQLYVQCDETKSIDEIQVLNSRKPEKSNIAGRESFKTDASLKRYVIDKAGFKCELGLLNGENHETFLNSKSNPYMEGHHIIPMSIQQYLEDVNLDRTENIISLCPNCHRAIHYGNEDIIKEILMKLYDYKKVDLESIDISITYEDLLRYYV